MRVEDVCPLTEGVERIPCHLTFKSKQWWFVTYLMVIFPRKTQVKESKSSATTAHQSNRHYPAEKSKSGAYGNTCFCKSKSHFQALQLRCMWHSWDLVGFQSLRVKEMADFHLHGWKIRYHSPKLLRSFCTPSLPAKMAVGKKAKNRQYFYNKRLIIWTETRKQRYETFNNHWT